MALATLSIDIVAKLAELQSGMDKAARLVEKESARMQASMNKLREVGKVVGAGLATAFAGFSAVGFIRATAESVDALIDLSEVTGATVENLSALELIAVKNGQTLENVEQVLVRFNAALNDAKPDNAIGKTLQAIGLDAEELRRIDPAEALRQVAVAFAGFADDGNKARGMQEIFSRSIRDAGPLLKELADQQTLTATMTRKQADEFKRFNDQLNELKANAAVFARDVTSPLIVGLNTLVQRYKDATTAGEGFLKFLARQTEIGQRFFGLSSSPATGGATGTWEDTQLPSLPPLSDKPKGDEPRQRMVSEVEKYIRRLEEAQIASLDLNAEEQARLDIALGKLGKLSKAQEEYVLLLARGLDLTKKTGEQLDQRGFRQFEIASGGPGDERLQRLAAIFDDTKTRQADVLRGRIEDLNSAFEAGLVPTTLYAESMIVLSDKLKALDPKFEETTSELSEFALQAQRNIQDALGDTLRDTLSGKWDNIAERWRNLLLDMAAQAIAARLGEKLFGSGSIFENFATLFAGFFADGGYIPPGKWGIVGERGPEPAFGGRTGLTVQPATAASGTVNYINVAAGPTRSEVMSAIQAAMGAVRAETDMKLRRAGVM